MVAAGYPVTVQPVPTHDKSSAAQFLSVLDPAAQRFTFQFFSDGDEGHAEILHGTLDEVWPKVQALNTAERRIGVFATISETDFRGRRAENVVRARALFVDADGRDQVRRCRDIISATGAKPTMVVSTSAGRAHFYWCCDDLPRDQFSALQGALIEKLGTDRAVKDMSRVMRLPGTLHLKNSNAPSKVTLLTSGRRWKLADLSAQLALHVAQSCDQAKPDPGLFTRAEAERIRRLFGIQHVSNELGEGIKTNIEEIKSAVAAIPLSVISTEPDWVKFARGLAHEARVHESQADRLWQVLDEASAVAPGYDHEENRRRWERYIVEAFDRDNPITIASVFDMARQHGWAGWVPQACTLQGNHSGTALPSLTAGVEVTFASIPHRQMLYGIDLYAGEVTVLAAPGGHGKTSLAIGIAVSLAANNKDALDEKIWVYQPTVLYINGEDSKPENLRRFWGFSIRHRIAEGDIKRLKLLAADDYRTQRLSFLRSDRGASVLDEQGVEFLGKLLEAIRPRVLVLDPLISFCGGGNANDNAVMALVMRGLKALAARFECAILILHHTRKGGEPGHPELISGASSIVNLSRRAIMIVPMTKEEATKFGVPPSEHRSYFKVVSAKSNMAPPSAECPWYKLESVNLPNAEPPTYPNGDNVQAVVRVKLSDLKKAGDPDDRTIKKAILDVIEGGKNVGGEIVPYSPNVSGAKNERSIVDDAMAAIQAATAPRQWHEGDLRAAVERTIARMDGDGWLVQEEIKKGRFRRRQGLKVDWDRTPWPAGGIAAEPEVGSRQVAPQGADQSCGQLVNGVVND